MVPICKAHISRNLVAACRTTVYSMVRLIALVIFMLPYWETALASQIRSFSDGRLAAIYGVSAGVFSVGGILEHFDRDATSVTAYRPNGIDSWFRARLRGGGNHPSNFLDNGFGGQLTPLLALSAISILDIHRREFSRDIPFFLAGQALTTGITCMAKSAISRPRPYMLIPDRDHHRSFFSGHTSSAYYAMGFLNIILRRHMRQNWTADEYRIGRWISPIVTFGWASYVGYSRIQADKHYFTDVAAGATVGLLITEFYYNMAYTSNGEDAGQVPTFLISFRLLL